MTDHFMADSSGDKNIPLDRRECPHCGLLFRLEEAKPVDNLSVRCPFCGWKVEKV